VTFARVGEKEIGEGRESQLLQLLDGPVEVLLHQDLSSGWVATPVGSLSDHDPEVAQALVLKVLPSRRHVGSRSRRNTAVDQGACWWREGARSGSWMWSRGIGSCCCPGWALWRPVGAGRPGTGGERRTAASQYALLSRSRWRTASGAHAGRRQCRARLPDASFRFRVGRGDWVLNSPGDSNDRPGMNEVSNQPLRRSTRPLDSGSFGGSTTSLVASVPTNEATPSARRWPRPITGLVVPDQPTRHPTEPPDQLPRPQQQILGLRVGIILAVMNLECAAVMTSTGNSLDVPSSSGIFRGGNHRSHCAASPGPHTNRSAGSGRRTCGRSRRTLSRNQRIEQPLGDRHPG
jgi:hypothetical protein